MPLPLTVDIGFAIAGMPGVRRHLWMTASPIDPGTCRTYWTVARNDRHDEDDESHLKLQRIVLAEDQPVVCNQVPPELPLSPGAELHIRADRVSVEYRRWLVELARAGTAAAPDELGTAITAVLGAQPAGAWGPSPRAI